MTTEGGARCFGVFGQPVTHSASPRMHNAAFATLGLPHRYHAFDVSPGALGDALRGAAAMGFGGINLTVPHKRAVLPLLDLLEPAAAAIGAVNTVTFGAAGTTGHNTDATGFVAGLRELTDAPLPRVVVLGGGGAARAVVWGLLEESASRHVDWVSRQPQGLPGWERSRPTAWGELDGRLGGADLLVNATSVGMAGGPPAFVAPVRFGRLAAGAAVIDVVYPAPPGGLVAVAKDAGRPAQDGLPMLLWQGVRALEHWLGEPLSGPVIAAMRAALGPAGT